MKVRVATNNKDINQIMKDRIIKRKNFNCMNVLIAVKFSLIWKRNYGKIKN